MKRNYYMLTVGKLNTFYIRRLQVLLYFMAYVLKYNFMLNERFNITIYLFI